MRDVEQPVVREAETASTLLLMGLSAQHRGSRKSDHVKDYGEISKARRIESNGGTNMVRVPFWLWLVIMGGATLACFGEAASSWKKGKKGLAVFSAILALGAIIWMFERLIHHGWIH